MQMAWQRTESGLCLLVIAGFNERLADRKKKSTISDTNQYLKA